MITIKATKQGVHKCGFCVTDDHARCPGGVLNGDGVTLILCGCKEHPLHLRCLSCGARGDAVNPDTWNCEDADACHARSEHSMEEVRRSLYGDPDSAPAIRAAEKAEKVTRAPAKPRAGKCLHCGEPTKGGLFLPGHDSAYLSAAVKVIKGSHDPNLALRETLDAWFGQGISEALRAKLTKRVA